jgi:hypothetical protein
LTVKWGRVQLFCFCFVRTEMRHMYP